MSKRTYVLVEVTNSEHVDHDEGLTEKEMLEMLANRMGYGLHQLVKMDGEKKKELTVNFYEDNSVVIDSHRHRVAFQSMDASFEIVTQHNNEVGVSVIAKHAVRIEEEA